MKQMGRIKVLATVSLAAIGFSACASSTQFTDVWKAPDVGTIQAHKVLVVCFTADESMRRVGEEELARHVTPPTQAVASYTILNKDQIRDLDYAKGKVKEMGFDLAVTMRAVGTDEKTTYVPGNYAPAPYGSYYGTYWNYHGYVAPAVYEPGYMQTTKYVLVESNIYSVTQDKLLWSGRSQTAEPSSVSDLVREVAKGARKVLIEQGLLAKE